MFYCCKNKLFTACFSNIYNACVMSKLYNLKLIFRILNNLPLGCSVRHTFAVGKKSKSNFLYSAVSSPQCALHFASLTDTQTPFWLLWEASSHMLQLMREGCSYTYPPLSITKYSFIQLNELEQCGVKKLAQGFNTTAQDSNSGSCSQESEALPLSHCAL